MVLQRIYTDGICYDCSDNSFVENVLTWYDIMSVNDSIKQELFEELNAINLYPFYDLYYTRFFKRVKEEFMSGDIRTRLRFNDWRDDQMSSYLEVDISKRALNKIKESLVNCGRILNNIDESEYLMEYMRYSISQNYESDLMESDMCNGFQFKLQETIMNDKLKVICDNINKIVNGEV